MSGGFRAALARMDRATAISALALTGAGLLVIGSAASEADRVSWVDQLEMFGVALAVVVPLLVVPYPKLLRRAGLAYAGLVLALALTLLFGPTINGSQRRLRFGIEFQPAEPFKVVLVAALARVLRFGRPLATWRDAAPPLLMIAIPCALVAKQPDLGTALLYVPTGLAVLVVAGLPWRVLATLGGLGAAFGAFAYEFLLRPYQRERVLSTLFRDRLADYERAREGWQLHQSLLAVRGGGAFGQGYEAGAVTQSGKLPYAYCDFAFAAIAEEAGFVGAAAVLLCALVLVASAFRVALTTRDPAGRLLCTGVGALIAAQTAVNAGVALGIVPTTGVPMPFVSHGGSSLATFWIGTALVLNVSMRRTGAPAPVSGAR